MTTSAIDTMASVGVTGMMVTGMIVMRVAMAIGITVIGMRATGPRLAVGQDRRTTNWVLARNKVLARNMVRDQDQVQARMQVQAAAAHIQVQVQAPDQVVLVGPVTSAAVRVVPAAIRMTVHRIPSPYTSICTTILGTCRRPSCDH